MARTKATHSHVVFEVRGRGEFPIDMLRYDMAAPYTGTDVSSILHPKMVAKPSGGEGEIEINRVVKLCRFYPTGGRRLPEAGRWLSFGWEVINVFEGTES
jgi:hypothetical protein